MVWLGVNAFEEIGKGIYSTLLSFAPASYEDREIQSIENPEKAIICSDPWCSCLFSILLPCYLKLHTLKKEENGKRIGDLESTGEGLTIGCQLWKHICDLPWVNDVSDGAHMWQATAVACRTCTLPQCLEQNGQCDIIF